MMTERDSTLNGEHTMKYTWCIIELTFETDTFINQCHFYKFN